MRNFLTFPVAELSCGYTDIDPLGIESLGSFLRLKTPVIEQRSTWLETLG